LFRRAIRSIGSGGSTALHGGWRRGAEQLAPLADSKATSRVSLLSDGCANHGLTGTSEIAAQCRELAAAGLSMVYLGAESGDDQVLRRVDKGETFDTTLDALDKLGRAGIKRSVMILNGLGGRLLSRQHAMNSARLMNAAQAEYLSTLVVSFPKGEARLRAGFPEWEPLSVLELLQELELFISALELKRTVFRSDHASNWLVLKGNLGADKASLLKALRQAIASPETARLRPAWARGL
jgi:radical SAM superfamily enzyme YgiQ (UPF0313 family)